MQPQIPVDDRLRVIEIYPSIQGESTWVGLPCVFVRLAGCNLRCTWCDSAFTFTGGEHQSVEDVVQEACSFEIDVVEVTGGEPLAHRQAIHLMELLLARGKTVLLETSGSIDIAPVPKGVHVIMDLKCPDSGEVDANLWANLEHLDELGEIKFVIASRRDYEWARKVCTERELADKFEVLFSPAHGLVDPAQLVDWMLEDRLKARLQIQMHKVIWPPDARGV
jgi:7-carboxy-7-deazaguanine synthase